MKPEEAAAVLAVARSKIYELMASGAIKSVKIGGLRRVSAFVHEEYVAALLEEGAA